MKKNLSTAIVTLVFTALATTVLSYVSLAVMIGPWIDPTLALCALGIVSLASWCSVSWLTRTEMLYATAAASMGGLLASAAAWSIPTLYFVDPALFARCVAQPIYFVGAVTLLISVAGVVGGVSAYYASSVWRDTATYSFPIAQLVVRTLTVCEHITQFVQLGYGALVSMVYHAGQALSYIPAVVTLVRQHQVARWLCVPAITMQTSMVPMLCAIGFIAGNLLVVPLLCGLTLRIFFMNPCYCAYFARCITEQNFIMAFCSGLLVHGVLHSFWKLCSSGLPAPVVRQVSLFRYIFLAFKSSKNTQGERSTSTRGEDFSSTQQASGIAGSMNVTSSSKPARPECFFNPRSASEGGIKKCIERVRAINPLYIITIILATAFLYTCASLSLLSIIYVLGATLVCAYQVMMLLGKIGLAPLGRFATFVMVPGMLLLQFTPLQAVLVAAFVELVCAAAATVASGLRIAGEIPDSNSERTMLWYQGFALCMSALMIAVIMWFFAHHFGFGSAPLFAQRARARALLIQVQEMHVGVLVIGLCAGVLLHLLNINTTLLLGGIFMSVSDTLLLILGGALSRLWRKPQTVEPFWSGVFTASSLWMISRVFLG